MQYIILTSNSDESSTNWLVDWEDDLTSDALSLCHSVGESSVDITCVGRI